jgi:hypothetical protein
MFQTIRLIRSFSTFCSHAWKRLFLKKSYTNNSFWICICYLIADITFLKQSYTLNRSVEVVYVATKWSRSGWSWCHRRHLAYSGSGTILSAPLGGGGRFASIHHGQPSCGNCGQWRWPAWPSWGSTWKIHQQKVFQEIWTILEKNSKSQRQSLILHAEKVEWVIFSYV